tara:strand:- start:403 stop:555 length:153 start_codon:yes stop_codon:yes gene_type:complete
VVNAKADATLGKRDLFTRVAMRFIICWFADVDVLEVFMALIADATGRYPL